MNRGKFTRRNKNNFRISNTMYYFSIARFHSIRSLNMKRKCLSICFSTVDNTQWPNNGNVSVHHDRIFPYEYQTRGFRLEHISRSKRYFISACVKCFTCFDTSHDMASEFYLSSNLVNEARIKGR